MTRASSLSAALLILAALSGCAVTGTRPDPALAPSAVILPDRFALLPSTAVPLPADRSALAALLPASDPAFMALRDRALAEAPSLALALARLDAARAAAARAGAERLPAIDAGASVTGTRSNPDSFGGNLPAGIAIDSERISYGATLSARWDADLFGGLRASERAARLRIDGASGDAAAVRLALTADIAAAVTDWRTLDARDAVLRDDLAAARTTFEIANRRAGAGIVPGFDAVRAQALVASIESQQAPLAAQRARIIGQLVALTGTGGDAVQSLLAVGGAPPSIAPPVAGVPSDLLRARPDIIAAEARLAAADADTAAVAARRFPKLTLSGTMGLLSFGIGDLFDSDSLIGSLAAGIAGPLFDFGRVQAEIDGSKAAARAAFATYRGAVFTALGEVEAGYGVVAASDAEYRAIAAQEAIDRDALGLASERYRRGLADLLIVLDAQRSLNATRQRLALAQGNAARARIALWQALGGDE